MSDPTARRGDNITALLDEIKKSRKGWTKYEMRQFLFKRYRYGIRKQTIDGIIQQLIDFNIIFGKPIKARSHIIHFHVNDKAVRL